MTLPKFLKEVDYLAAGCTRNELEAFVHEVARTLPETKRNHFIHTLQLFGNLPAETVLPERTQDDVAGLIEAVGTVKEKLAAINEGDCCLDSEYNEEWDEWYNSDADEVLFVDPQGLLKDINKALDLIHSCVDMEAYQAGCELSHILSVLEVTVEGDYDDYNGSDEACIR